MKPPVICGIQWSGLHIVIFVNAVSLESRPFDLELFDIGFGLKSE